jgi:pyridoxamine 5'-phosphate oxidase
MSQIRPESNPYVLFGEWYDLAQQQEPKYPDGMSLATVDPDGLPDVRTVLLKGLDERGFVFYTNFNSAKGRQLAAHPQAAINFYWKSLDRQVRARGPLEVVTEAEADAYFLTRPRISRLGAWASRQSEEIASREVLLERLRAVDQQYPGEDVPRPPHWSGWRLMPREIEFWAEADFRLHDRRIYRQLPGGGWSQAVLSP